MKIKHLPLVLVLCVQGILAQTQYLSNQAEISLLTVGPGLSLNDSFGHSGFRIKDTTGLDVVFNYGVYDFEAPNFYLKFAQGKLDYLIGANYFKDFLNNYIEENRTVEEQVLNLNQKEKQSLYNFLLVNYQPQNRRYKYDFFYDNCATKIKDVVLLSVSQPVKFNEPESYQPATFRQLIQQNLKWNSWGSVGIDIALGAVIDKQTMPEDHMFLPENVARFFEVASIGSDRPLVKKSDMLYQKKEGKEPTSGPWNPLLVFSLLAILIVAITFRDFKKKTRTRALDLVLFLITGLIGIGLLLLWFATDHTATAFNYNLLWAFPLNVWVAFLVVKKNVNPWIRKYLKFSLVLLGLMLFHWISGVQVFALALIPLLLALAIRYLYLLRSMAS